MKLNGNPVSPGIAVTKAFHYIPFVPEVCMETVEPSKAPEELAAYKKALEGSLKELEAVVERLKSAQDEKYKIFEAHADIASDEVMNEEIEALINDEHSTALSAVEAIYNQYIEVLGSSKDKLISERTADLKDVKKRMQRNLLGIEESNISSLSENVIIIAHDLFPSDTATLDKEHVSGIITEIGGTTSHTAIIAREYGIPAIVGVAGALESLTNGSTIAMDATNGVIESELSEETIASYNKKKSAFLEEKLEIEQYLHNDAFTADGVRIQLGANVGGKNDDIDACASFTDFIGLFRTEFLYMSSSSLPDEDTQFEVYKKTLMAYGDRPVTLRTLDVGGDKTLPCLPLPKEDNPFLGNRALRLCFSMPEIFKTQLRAALRASVYGNLWIMLPMVGSLDDVRRAKAILDDVKAELKSQNIPFNPEVKLGIMIEIPSIAMMADIVVKEVDFASIGTNDLCQYTLAVDRINPTVSSYYQSYHPALFRLMGYAVEQFNKKEKPISVCGELGGDELAAPVLVGLGMRKLSMSASSVARIKKVLSKHTVKEMEDLAAKVVSSATAEEAKKYMLELQGGDK
jgi:phosphotransferase system enzyme I (PtsI)